MMIEPQVLWELGVLVTVLTKGERGPRGLVWQKCTSRPNRETGTAHECCRLVGHDGDHVDVRGNWGTEIERWA